MKSYYGYYIIVGEWEGPENCAFASYEEALKFLMDVQCFKYPIVKCY